jgi:3-hydroxy acid dehydrogenase / malonic semialdehyde reductase
VDAELGGLDILINNAGLAAEGPQDMDENAWRYAEELAETTLFTLTRSARTDVVSMRVEPLLEKAR